VLTGVSQIEARSAGPRGALSVAKPADTRRFFKILSQVQSEGLLFIAVMAPRSDFLGKPQSAAPLTARFEEFSLGQMPLSRIPEIIRGLAQVAGPGIKEAFVQQAARDAETEDALPLLAFTPREFLTRVVEQVSHLLEDYKGWETRQRGAG